MNDLAQTIRTRLKKPLVMIGLMGAGKTKIGGMLADALALPCVDADQEIEMSAGCSIADIFERDGEAVFRDMERKVIARLMTGEPRVISTGGGAVMNEQTASLVFEKSISIWLRAELDTLVERTSHNKKRPLLQNGNPRDILAALMEKRYPVYGRAVIVTDTDSPETEATLQKLLKALDTHLRSADTGRHE